MKLHRYVDHQRLHIVTKDIISLSISVLLLFRHYISHKITFGAPSSGGVLRSACGAFIPMIFFSTIFFLFTNIFPFYRCFSYFMSIIPRKVAFKLKAHSSPLSYRDQQESEIWMYRPLVKSAYPKNNFLISQANHMLWVLKITVSMRLFF